METVPRLYSSCTQSMAASVRCAAGSSGAICTARLASATLSS